MKPEAAPHRPPLFRTEVLEAQGTKLLGQVILTPKASTLWLCIACALVGAAIVAFLVLGSYTRRATVTGQLIPSSGVMRIHTPQAGVVLEKKVDEGQLVKKVLCCMCSPATVWVRTPAKSRPISAARSMPASSH